MNKICQMFEIAHIHKTLIRPIFLSRRYLSAGYKARHSYDNTLDVNVFLDIQVSKGDIVFCLSKEQNN